VYAKALKKTLPIKQPNPDSSAAATAYQYEYRTARGYNKSSLLHPIFDWKLQNR